MKNWISTWGLAHADIRQFHPGFKKRTMRLALRNNLRGEAVRVRFSNRDGNKALQIIGAALRTEDTIPLQFAGKTVLRLEPGQEACSDAIPLAVGPGMIITLSAAFAGAVSSGNSIPAIIQCSPRGNFVDAVQFPSAHLGLTECYYGMLQPIPALSAVEVLTEEPAHAVVCFGDSITQQGRWTGPLEEILYRQYPGQIALLNKGIGGNRLLHGPLPLIGRTYGTAGKDRFQRDVLEEPGAKTVILALGTNDIGMARGPADTAWTDATAIAQGLTLLVRNAKTKGLRVFGTTVLPRGGTQSYRDVQEKERIKLNGWLRKTDIFDAVFDFDAALRDPAHPGQLAFAYDSGDHLHPGTMGGSRMAACIVETLEKKQLAL